MKKKTNFKQIYPIILFCAVHFIVSCLYLYKCRYIEYVCYKGFMESIGKHMVAKELLMKSENVYLLNVYTDVDFKLRRNHIQTKATKGSEGKCDKRNGKRKRKGLSHFKSVTYIINNQILHNFQVLHFILKYKYYL